MNRPVSPVPVRLRVEPSAELVAALPPDLAEAVFVAGNGELFWPRSWAPVAAAWLAERAGAIAGGEVYVPRPPAWGSFVREWWADPPVAGEPWPEFVARCLERTLAEVERSPGPVTFAFDPDQALYFLAVVSAPGPA